MTRPDSLPHPYDFSVDEVVGERQSDLRPREEAKERRWLFGREKQRANASTGTLGTLDEGSPIYVITGTGARVPVEISATVIEVDGEERCIGIVHDILRRREVEHRSQESRELLQMEIRRLTADDGGDARLQAAPPEPVNQASKTAVYSGPADRAERERALEQAEREAEEAARLKTAMLANMSHELRTPLTAIIGFSEVLKDNLEGEMATFAEKTHSSGQRLMKTLDSVLQLSKLEAGTDELEREWVRVDRVVREAVELFRPQAGEKPVILAMEISDAPVDIQWNEGALMQVLENLLENAIKFTPEGGRVDVRVRTDETAAVLEVEDTGIGISDAFQAQMFEAFKQESEGLQRKYEGTGLGLPIAKHLVEALGGSIEVHSEKGVGTCFTVRLPLGEEE